MGLERCDGSDGKAVDSGLKGSKFKPPPKAKKSERSLLLIADGCLGTFQTHL